jgi:hypothetical protein
MERGPFPSGSIAAFWHDGFLCSSLRQFIKSNGHPEEAQMLSDFNPMSSVALCPAHQVVLEQLKDKRLPARISDCLEAQPRESPFLYNAGDSRGRATSYGQALDFIRGAGGDLRQIGVQQGQMLAYCAPVGASAVGALTFLAVGAQTAAAPGPRDDGSGRAHRTRTPSTLSHLAGSSAPDKT